MEARHLMKRGLTAVLAGALAAVLLVPVATATPGKGNGHGNGGGSGNGAPASAGGGGGGGKPDWAGKQTAKAEQAARKAERQAARESTAEDAEPKHDNPAWVCKFERDRMGAEAFADQYGENENKANAFGKCVSQEAQDRDGVTPEPTEDEDTTETGDEEAPGSDELPDEDDSALPASVQAFLHFLWPLLF
jgi:hypothetical protein